MRLGSWYSLSLGWKARASHYHWENWRGGCTSGQEPWEEQRGDLKGHHGKAGACRAQEKVSGGGDGYGRDGESAALHSARTQRPRALWAGSGCVASQWRVRGGSILPPPPPLPAPLPAPRAVPSLRPASCPATSLCCCRAALPAHLQPGGHQEAEAGRSGVRARRTAAPGPKFASSPGRPSGSHAPLAAPSRILTPASLRRGIELRPG